MILIGLAVFIAIWLAVFWHLDPDDFRRPRYRNSRWEDDGKRSAP